ncbi:MAG: hypothetical protein E7588_00710 [Ruminococcaceae bacterium]|nr:hypothetical protein [Oscillospiraceae bacterium]
MLKAGFARIDITPQLGTCIAGYYARRVADGIVDPLLASALVVDDGEKRAAILSIDVISIPTAVYKKVLEKVCEVNKLDPAAVIMACTHTHTGPVFADTTYNQASELYNEMFACKISDVVALAIQDLKPVEIKTGLSKAENISFIRRYKMKDGKVQTNPGVDNPNIDHPIGENDESVQVVSLAQQGGHEIILVNFQVHADVVGGTKFSADFPKYVRDTVEEVLPNTKCIFYNGAEGDTNHINVHPPKTKRKIEIQHANIGEGGVGHAKTMGRIIAGTVLGLYEKLEPSDDGNVDYRQDFAIVGANKGTPEEIEAAIPIVEKDKRGEFVTNNMEDVSLLAKCYRVLRMEKFPSDHHELRVTAIKFANICFVAFPGEPFTEIGRQVKNASGFERCFICCCANGSEGYFPTRDAYEGGYESGSSPFKPNVAEVLINKANELVKELR